MPRAADTNGILQGVSPISLQLQTVSLPPLQFHSFFLKYTMYYISLCFPVDCVYLVALLPHITHFPKHTKTQNRVYRVIEGAPLLLLFLSQFISFLNPSNAVGTLVMLWVL